MILSGDASMPINKAVRRVTPSLLGRHADGGRRWNHKKSTEFARMIKVSLNCPALPLPFDYNTNYKTCDVNRFIINRQPILSGCGNTISTQIWLYCATSK
jgi:hypothetical protein